MELLLCHQAMVSRYVVTMLIELECDIASDMRGLRKSIKLFTKLKNLALKNSIPIALNQGMLKGMAH